MYVISSKTLWITILTVRIFYLAPPQTTNDEALCKNPLVHDITLSFIKGKTGNDLSFGYCKLKS